MNTPDDLPPTGTAILMRQREHERRAADTLLTQLEDLRQAVGEDPDGDRAVRRIISTVLLMADALDDGRTLLELVAHISPTDEPAAGSVGEKMRTALALFYGMALLPAGAPSPAVEVLQRLVAWNHDVNGSGDELGRLLAAAECLVGRNPDLTDNARHGADLLAFTDLLAADLEFDEAHAALHRDHAPGTVLPASDPLVVRVEVAAKRRAKAVAAFSEEQPG